MNLQNIKVKLDFAIVGAQKSATTSMQYYLSDHPSITLPLGEIACFESPDFEQGRVMRQIGQLSPASGTILGFKRPTLCSDTVAIDRLKNYAPNCRLIMVCREPVSRFVSAYFHLMNSGKIPVKEINQALREIFYGKYLSKYAAGTSLLRNGLYHGSLAHIKAVYGSECLFATSQEAIRLDYEGVMRDTCKFLNVPFHPPRSLEGREKNAGSYDYRRARFLRLSNALTYTYSLGRSRKEIRTSRSMYWIGRGLSSTFRRWPFINPISRDELLTTESEELLQDYYRHDKVELLQDFPEIVYWQ